MGDDKKGGLASILKQAVSYAAPAIGAYAVSHLKDLAKSRIAQGAKLPLDTLLKEYAIEHRYSGTNTRGMILIGGKATAATSDCKALALRGIPREQFEQAAEALDLGFVARRILKYAHGKNLALLCEVSVEGAGSDNAGQTYTGSYPLERTRITRITLTSVDGEPYGSITLAPGSAELPAWCNYKVGIGTVNIKGKALKVYPFKA